MLTGASQEPSTWEPSKARSGYLRQPRPLRPGRAAARPGASPAQGGRRDDHVTDQRRGPEHLLPLRGLRRAQEVRPGHGAAPRPLTQNHGRPGARRHRDAVVRPDRQRPPGVPAGPAPAASATTAAHQAPSVIGSWWPAPRYCAQTRPGRPAARVAARPDTGTESRLPSASVTATSSGKTPAAATGATVTGADAVTDGAGRR